MTDDTKPAETPATPVAEPQPLSITPFKDTNEAVRAFNHPKFEGQYILADGAGNILCVCPSLDKARLVYESVNGFFQATAMRNAMMEQRRAEQAKAEIDRKLIITP